MGWWGWPEGDGGAILSSGDAEDRGDRTQAGGLACVRRWNGTSWNGRTGGSVGEDR